MKQTEILPGLSFAVQGVLFLILAIVAFTTVPHLQFRWLISFLAFMILCCGVVQTACAAVTLLNSVLSVHILFRGCIEIAAAAVLFVHPKVTPQLLDGITGIVLLEKAFTAFYLAFAVALVPGADSVPRYRFRMLHVGGLFQLAAAALFVVYAIKGHIVPPTFAGIAFAIVSAVHFAAARLVTKVSTPSNCVMQ